MSDWTGVKRDRRLSQHDFQDLGRGGSGLFQLTMTEITWKLKTTVKLAHMFRATTTKEKNERQPSTLKSVVFWDVMQCSLGDRYKRFGVIGCLHLRDRRDFSDPPLCYACPKRWSLFTIYMSYPIKTTTFHSNRLEDVKTHTQQY
jgi:hypothetical protein